MNIQSAKALATRLAKSAWNDIKENPGEVLLACITIAAFDIADSMDAIEDMDGFLFIDETPEV